MGVIAVVVAAEPDDVHVDALATALHAAGHQTRRVEVRAAAETDAAFPRVGSLVAVVVPNGTLDFEQSPRSAQLLRDAHDAGLVVGGLGFGVEALVDAGVARGRTVSAPGAVLPELVEKGGRASRDPITTDGALVTASSPVELAGFVGALCRAIGERERRRHDVPR